MSRRVDYPPAFHPIAWVGLWLVLVIVALVTRPLLPVDETRYLAVAWEMWTSTDRLVPHLNGRPYSDKPPLLFWLINLGWWLFGVSDTVGRLVSPLFALASLFATAALARLLWPREVPVRLLAPWVVLGSLVWTGAATLSMFDVMLMFFTLVALIGVVVAARATAGLGRARRSYAWFIAGWLLFGAGAGLGALSKGPIIILFTFPAVLLAPLWLPKARGGNGIGRLVWYAGALGGITLGAAIGFGWALAAAAQGGEEYGQAILWGQTSGRVVNSFAHERPIWWYLPMLFLLLFPWMCWPALWGSCFGTPVNHGCFNSSYRLGLPKTRNFLWVFFRQRRTRTDPQHEWKNNENRQSLFCMRHCCGHLSVSHFSIPCLLRRDEWRFRNPRSSQPTCRSLAGEHGSI